MGNILLPVYIINLPNRKDRLKHSLSQFKDREEFEINVIEAVVNDIGAVGLWESIKKAIRISIDKDEDLCIICEDDHTFTENYSPSKLISDIFEAYRLGGHYLLGGITGGFSNMFYLPSGLCWLDTFWGTQFVVVFRSFYEAILNEVFFDTDAADVKLSEMTSNKFVMYPMISHQKEFGYSDVTNTNSEKGYINKITTEAELRIENLVKKSKQYKNI